MNCFSPRFVCLFAYPWLEILLLFFLSVSLFKSTVHVSTSEKNQWKSHTVCLYSLLCHPLSSSLWTINSIINLQKFNRIFNAWINTNQTKNSFTILNWKRNLNATPIKLLLFFVSTFILFLTKVQHQIVNTNFF